jgi:hypothetical protein
LAKVEFECRKCGKTETADQYKISRFCLDCATLLTLRPQPKHWLFQFSPSLYLWFERITDTREPEQWLISQHSKLIRSGDLVAIWSSGQKAGIYALGRIMTNPKRNSLNPSQEKYFLNKDDANKFNEKHSAWVEYSKLCLEKPLLQEECRQDRALLGLQVFMNPQGTNFRLTTEQWNRILELTDEK